MARLNRLLVRSPLRLGFIALARFASKTARRFTILQGVEESSSHRFLATVIFVASFALFLLSAIYLFAVYVQLFYNCRVILASSETTSRDCHLSSPIISYIWLFLSLPIPSGPQKNYLDLDQTLNQFYSATNKQGAANNNNYKNVIVLDNKGVNSRIYPNSFQVNKTNNATLVTKKLNNLPLNIPKIIHQSFANNSLASLPREWGEASYSVHFFHGEGYLHYFWTDETMRTFIADEYPDFLPTYDAYPFVIQRVDAFRYFALYHFGGFWCDLDIGARRPFDPLLNISGCGAVLAETWPFGFSNDFMAFRPRHPFLRRAIEALPKWSRTYGLPYLTVMLTTGSAFLSAQYRLMISDDRWASSNSGDIKVLKGDAYVGSHGFLWHVVGNSWHSWDASIILAIGHNLTLLTFITLTFIALVIGRWFGLFRFIGRYYRITISVNDRQWHIV